MESLPLHEFSGATPLLGWCSAGTQYGNEYCKEIQRPGCEVPSHIQLYPHHALSAYLRIYYISYRDDRLS